MTKSSDIQAASWAAAVASGAMIATHIAAKAARDALFLSNFAVTELPRMLVVSAVLSIGMVLLASRVLVRLGPKRVVPLAFLLSAALLLGLWGLIQGSPATAAILLYLHVSSFGVILISGFWSLVNERFDPHTAKKMIGRIVGAATLGGLAGGVGAERLAALLHVTDILPILAGLHILCAWQTFRLGRGIRPLEDAPASEAAHGKTEERRGILATLARAHYLRNLGLLVVLGTMAAAVLDYIYKVEATTRFGRADELMRFFAAYYVAVGLLTFGVQALLSRRILERLGLARTAAFLPGAAAIGGLTILLTPGLVSAVAARFTEAVLRSSLFRSAYELFFIPVSPRDKRATKTLIDVGFDRFGDLLGGGLITLVLILAPVAVGNRLLLAVAVGLSVVALWILVRLQKGYVDALEESLARRIISPSSPEFDDALTRTVVMRTLTHLDLQRQKHTLEALRLPRTVTDTPAAGTPTPQPTRAPAAVDDPVVARILDLRSGETARIRRALARPEEVDPRHVAHVLPLIARADARQLATEALRHLAPRVTGQLLDALLDPQEEFIIRRRLPRVIEVCNCQRAVDGLLAALSDRRFEVRYKCGIALARILDRNPDRRIDRRVVFERVMAELAVDPYVWQDRRLLDEPEDSFASIFSDDLLRTRIQHSLEHVFNLLSLALDRRALKVAYRGLHTEDDMLRGTALEYLDVILPAGVLTALRPWLGEVQPELERRRDREAVEAELLKSSASIDRHLSQLLR